MFNRPSSRNLNRRLSNGSHSGRDEQRFGADSLFVQHVRAYVIEIPERNKQHNRLKQEQDNWLVSQYRWIMTQRESGIEWSQIRRVLQACCDECDVLEQMEALGQPTVSADTFAAAVQAETEAQYLEDAASNKALHERSLAAYQVARDRIARNIEALRAKYQATCGMIYRLTHRSAV